MVAEAIGPASNVRTHGVAASIAVLSDVTDRLLADAPDPDDVAAVCAGLAGAGHAKERAPIEAWLDGRFTGLPTTVVADVELVLAGGTPDRVGIAIVAGTGSIAFARDRRGMTARAGGRGPAIGDPGSGYAIGRAALIAITESLDGVRPESAMIRRFREQELVVGPDGLGAWSQPADLATLAELVAESADAGDGTAARILVTAGAALAAQALAVLRRLGFHGKVPAALAGGVLLNVPRVRDTLLERLGHNGVQLAPIELVEHPVTGAIRLAEGLSQSGAASR